MCEIHTLKNGNEERAKKKKKKKETETGLLSHLVLVQINL